VKSIRDVPGIPGLKEVVADSSVVYMDENGQYLFFGTLLDMKNKLNVTEARMAEARVSALESIPVAEKIVLQAPQEKYRVTVFTDTTCGYCKLLHQNEQGYLDRGITIEYVAFPRGGTQSEAFPVMRQVWCSKDRYAAYKLASEGKPVPQVADCADPVGKHYNIGDKMAIEGTPAIFTADGKQLGGFLPPDQLEAKLKAGQSNVNLASAE
jgi:thiol:disulfide interchange protein DsbC